MPAERSQMNASEAHGDVDLEDLRNRKAAGTARLHLVPTAEEVAPTQTPIAAEMQNHAKMVQSACGEPRRSLRDKHEREGSDEQTRFHQSEHSGTCSRHGSCRWQRPAEASG